MALSDWRSAVTPVGKHAAASRGVPCGRAVKTGPSAAGLRPFGRDDGQGGPKGRLITVIPSEAVQSAAMRREAEESVRQRREATPLVASPHGVSGWRTDQRSAPLESMLRLRVRCLVEVLFKRVPPLRAFGPSVGMTVKGAQRGASSRSFRAKRCKAQRRAAKPRNPFFSVAQRHRLCSCGMMLGVWWVVSWR